MFLGPDAQEFFKVLIILLISGGVKGGSAGLEQFLCRFFMKLMG